MTSINLRAFQKEIKMKLRTSLWILLSFMLLFSIIPSLNATQIVPVSGVIPKPSLNQDGSQLPNIIVMIGDGMGPEYMRIASLVEYGSVNATILDTAFPVHSLYDTRNIKGEITDSAAGGTAISTGFRTANGRIAMDQYANINYKTILEYLLHDANYSTGIVTTTDIAHATPATFTAHVPDRDMKAEILDQELRQGIDVVLGGSGLKAYTSPLRELAKNINETYGYPVAYNRSQLLSMSQTYSRLVGIFGKGHLPYETERNTTKDPSIVEMTRAALDILSRSEKPFFLMVEGGRIDHAGHDRNATNAVIETIMFEKAIRYARSFAESIGNTIVVVGADHETGGFRMNSITDLGSELPTFGYTREQNMTIRYDRISKLDVSFLTSSHTNTLIGFWGFGPGMDNSTIKVEKNIDIFWTLNKILGAFPVFSSYSYRLYDNGTLFIDIGVEDQDQSATSVLINIRENNAETSAEYIEKIQTTSGVNKYAYSVDPTSNYSLSFILIDPSSPFNVSSFISTPKLYEANPTNSSPPGNGPEEATGSAFLPILSGFQTIILLLGVASFIQKRKSQVIT